MRQEQLDERRSNDEQESEPNEFRGFEELLYQSLDQLLANVQVRNDLIRMTETEYQ